ncbi:CAAX amino terminal protease self- immunity [compost metagenome]
MKKLKFRDTLRRTLEIDSANDRLLLMNLYITQGLTLVLALFIFLFQRQNPLRLFYAAHPGTAVAWGLGFGAAVLLADMLVSRWVPEEAADDGGINKMLFGKRAVWHIALISAVAALCEELLFRGAVQHAWGPYWTSILFAAIHVRYLRHWVPTGLVFGISYGLGWIYQETGTIWCPIIAHFVIDLVMGLILRFRKEEAS